MAVQSLVLFLGNVFCFLGNQPWRPLFTNSHRQISYQSHTFTLIEPLKHFFKNHWIPRILIEMQCSFQKWPDPDTIGQACNSSLFTSQAEGSWIWHQFWVTEQDFDKHVLFWKHTFSFLPLKIFSSVPLLLPQPNAVPRICVIPKLLGNGFCPLALSYELS